MVQKVDTSLAQSPAAEKLTQLIKKVVANTGASISYVFGSGIIVVTDAEGKRFKVEISEVGRF